MVDIIELCREAWQQSKLESQPAYDELIPSYRDMLTARAEATLAGEYVSDGPFAAFETLIRDSTRRTAEVADAAKLAPKHHLKGKLPEDFPSWAKLHEAGINTYGQLAKTDDLTTIDGIGPAGEKQIRARLKADEKEAK